MRWWILVCPLFLLDIVEEQSYLATGPVYLQNSHAPFIALETFASSPQRPPHSTAHAALPHGSQVTVMQIQSALQDHRREAGMDYHTRVKEALASLGLRMAEG